MSDDHPPFTLERAWEDLRYAVAMILTLFGGPADIAARKMLLNRTRQEILIWLAPIEAMARRILLLAALKLPTLNPTARLKRGAPIVNAMRDTPLPTLSDNPADWRVLFSDWPCASGASTERQTERRGRDGSGAARFCDYNAYPLARRIEALVRLVQHPAASIERMARKITVRRAHLCFAFGRYRHNAMPVETLLKEVQTHVDAALWNTS
jgi:hypothetical protein